MEVADKLDPHPLHLSHHECIWKAVGSPGPFESYLPVCILSKIQFTSGLYALQSMITGHAYHLQYIRSEQFQYIEYF